jgi:TolB-like protein/DNA-binding winged helix-turn-helix (wHTH) protein/Tfp pilus assembly protein PilF
MESPASESFEINGVVVDVAAGTLRDRAGREVALRPQAFKVLVYLLDNAGRLVSKDELMKQVWPDVFVTDDSLVQCIRDVRRALGDEKQSVLRTVPRRGYRLVVSDVGCGKPTVPWRLVGMAGIAVLALILAGIGWRLVHRSDEAGVALPSVAVIPLKVIGGGSDERRLADGLTEDIITDLARFPEFRVIASDTSAGYAGTRQTSQASAALNAAFIVEGSIQRQGDRMRITAQLVESATGRHLWSDRWDKPSADLFAVQIEIAEQVANRVGGGAGLIQEAGRREAHRKPPANLNAYELYLLGTERLEQINPDDVQEAIRLLTSAVEEDPALARAWVELAHCYDVLANFGIQPEENMRRQVDAARRALTLDPGDAEARAVYAIALAERGDLPRAKAQFDTALSMGPNQFEILAFYVPWAAKFGEPERGASLADRAIALNPNFPMWSARPLNYAYFMVGRYADALRMTDRLTPENYGRWVWVIRPAALAAVGRVDEARVLVTGALERFPDLTVEGFINDHFSDAERQRLIETMTLAGFPRCAGPEYLEKIERPVRLSGCNILVRSQ